MCLAKEMSRATWSPSICQYNKEKRAEKCEPMTLIRLLMIACLTMPAGAQEQEEQPAEQEPLDPAYNAVHGFVIVNSNSSLFAYVMPTYSKPQDVQLLYRLSTKDPNLRYLVRDADLVTMKPERFNLQRLMRNESFSVKADVYMGHFQRGGERIYEQYEVTFDELLYSRALNELASPTSTQVYEKVDVSNSMSILVHQIQKKPSYDQLILVSDPVSCILNLSMSTSVPQEYDVLRRLLPCGTLKPLYYDTAEFQ